MVSFFYIRISTKIGTYSNAERLGTTWNDLQRSETNYNEQETTWNDLQRARNNLKRPTTSKKQPTTIWGYQQRAKKDAKPPPTSRFWDYFTVLGNRLSSLTRFPPNTWLQLSEHCFMENHGENRALNICILSCLFITGYNIYWIRCEPLWHW